MSIKTIIDKIWFKNSRYSRMICPCCGFRFEMDDCIVKITVADKTEYFHEDCLSEMGSKETLEHFNAIIEEVEI